MNQSSLVLRTPKDLALLGDTELVAAQAGKAIRVLAMAVVTPAAVTIFLKSASTKITPSIPLGVNGSFALPYCEHGWFETNVGEALIANQSLAVASGVLVIWVAV